MSLTTSKEIYVLTTLVLIGVAYYYFKSSKKELESVEETEILQAPPGYVTVTVEMLQGIQQGNNYDNVPQNNNVNFQLNNHFTNSRRSSK